MPRISHLQLSIETGQNGWDGPVSIAFNGHELPLEKGQGGCSSGETLNGELSPNSFAHSVVLVGPESGAWDIAGLKVTYEVPGEESYTIRFGAITLGDAESLDIWQERPLLTFDV
jgi:hypothetical protein